MTNRRLFKDAHEMTRAAIRPGDDYRATFAAALRILYQRRNAAAEHSAAIRAEWNAMQPDEQLAFCAKCLNRASRDIIGMSSGDEYSSIYEKTAFGTFSDARLRWLKTDLDEYHNATYLKVLESLQRLEESTGRRIENGKAPRSLAFIVYNAAKAAIMQIYRAEIKHGVADIRERENADGTRESYTENAIAAADDTAADTIRRLDLSAIRSNLDPLDKLIFDGIAAGASLDAIAEKANRNRSTINYRRQRLLATLRDYIAD